MVCILSTCSSDGHEFCFGMKMLSGWSHSITIFFSFEGNEIEWKYPASTDLIGVEFKALASGSHTITKDFM